MCNIFIETYDIIGSDICIGVDVYDLDCFMIGEGFYHIPSSSLVFKDLVNGEMINIKCFESDILSVVCDYFGEDLDHIL